MQTNDARPVCDSAKFLSRATDFAFFVSRESAVTIFMQCRGGRGGGEEEEEEEEVVVARGGGGGDGSGGGGTRVRFCLSVPVRSP